MLLWGRRQGRAIKVVYRGAGASPLGPQSGVKTKEEADALIEALVGKRTSEQKETP